MAPDNNSFAKDRVQAIKDCVRHGDGLRCSVAFYATPTIKQILAASGSQAGRIREILSMSGAHRSIIA
jgi:hypothetical protein